MVEASSGYRLVFEFQFQPKHHSVWIRKVDIFSREMSRHSVNLSEKEIEDKIQEFQDWIKDQPQLPQNLGNLLE